MSNHLAIATATETLRQVIQQAAANAVPGATAKPARPEPVGNTPSGPEVRIYLYQVTPNAHWRNADLPTRRGNGEAVQRPQVALDLHYLVAFYGNDSDHEPQRLLGSVASALHSQPTLTREQVQQAANSVPELVTSDLAQQVDLVRVSPELLSLEEVSKLWSVFFQTAYVLSMPYIATVVLIESQTTTSSAPPVVNIGAEVVPFPQSIIEAVHSELGKQAPIVADSVLKISGHGLGSTTNLLISDIDLTGEITHQTATEITLPLPTPAPSALRSGIQSVRALQQLMLGQPATPHRGFESNVAAFVLRPTLDPLPSVIGVPTSEVIDGMTYQTGILRCDFRPVVGRNQRVVLLLNEDTGTAPARAYAFGAPTNNGITTQATETQTIDFEFAHVATGDYFVRVQVDGAESPLDHGSGGFTGPKVTI